ncbi:MAG: AbrB/MazE/SpoVT family DNA-binding domain-containing protein [Alphaproteobacteria bacterium]|nr:AbrB/MazE/SpoVT family DNA-binding domain-containing protein [Alphaproteobacteria bacterium]
MLATITSKGQVTLPKRVRDELKLKPGDRLDFRVMPDGTLVARPATRRAEDIVGILKRPDQRAVPVEDIDEAIGRRVAELDDRSRR